MVATVAPNRTGPSPSPAVIANAGPAGITNDLVGGDVEDLVAGADAGAFAVAVAVPAPLGRDFDLQAEPAKATRAKNIMQVAPPLNDSPILRRAFGEEFVCRSRE